MESPSFPSAPADVVLYDASDGLYGELLDPQTVVVSSSSAGQQMHSGADLSDVPNHLRSVRYGYADTARSSSESEDIPINFYNYSTSFVRIRWIDTSGQSPPSHVWTLAPNQEINQSTSAGHVFVLSTIIAHGEQDLFGSNETEAVLGAYRPKRALPSGVHHALQVHDGDGDGGYILEVVLLDESSYDALVVASSWLDKQVVLLQNRQDSVKTLGLLHTIVSNVIEEPMNDKYRKLRLSNSTVEKRIVRHWSPMEFLRVLGFVRQTLPNDNGKEDDDEEYLVAEKPNELRLELYRRAVGLLDQLKRRCSPGFVVDVAPPTPWDEPVLLSGGSGGGGRGRWRDGAHFMSDEDRWARVERARRFRRNAGPRPAPGNAPSDRGRWGRPR